MNAPLLLLLAALPNHQLLDIDGPQLLTELRRSSEELIVVNVWATWCGPCVRELPMLFEVQKQFEGRVRFMFVSADFKSQRASAAKLMAEKGAKLPTYFQRGKDQSFIDALHPDWNGTIPATFLFDRRGRRLEFWQGMLTEKELVGALDRLLDR